MGTNSSKQTGGNGSSSSSSTVRPARRHSGNEGAPPSKRKPGTWPMEGCVSLQEDPSVRSSQMSLLFRDSSSGSVSSGNRGVTRRRRQSAVVMPLRRVDFGGRTSIPRDVPTDSHRDPTWVEMVEGKLATRGHPMQWADQRNLAYVLGDSKMYLAHFFAGDATAAAVDHSAAAAMGDDTTPSHDAVAGGEGASVDSHAASFTGPLRAIQAAAKGTAAAPMLTVSLVFDEAVWSCVDGSCTGHGGDAAGGYVAPAAVKVGTLHAGICVNGAIVLNWGTAAFGLPDIVSQQDVVPGHGGPVADQEQRPADMAARTGITMRADVGLVGLEHICDAATYWNRDKRFSTTASNSQHFVRDVMERLGIRFALWGRTLQHFLEEVADGSVWHSSAERERGVLCFICNGDRYTFATACELNEFVAAGSHMALPEDAQYLLCVFHQVFKRRALDHPSDPRWMPATDAAEFDWVQFGTRMDAAVAANAFEHDDASSPSPSH